MFKSSDFVLLYNAVLSNVLQKYPVSPDTIESASKNVVKAYLPQDAADWNRTSPRGVDYNHAAHRCAYLHKYAPLHSCLVQDVLNRILEDVVLKENISAKLPDFKICSLGGGPGTDVFGVLSAMREAFGTFNCSASIVDSSRGWEETLDSALEILRESRVPGWSPDYFRCTFIEADLLRKHHQTVNRAIGSADLVNMVKFLSSVICKDAETMVRKIFHSMRPGAFLLFIDNDAGGYSELMSRLGRQCSMQSVFGPVKHLHYADRAFHGRRYGYTSCSKTRVSVHVLMKPEISRKWKWTTGRNFPTRSLHQSKLLCGMPLEYNRHSKPAKRRKVSSTMEYPVCKLCGVRACGESKTHRAEDVKEFDGPLEQHAEEFSAIANRCETFVKRYYELRGNNFTEAAYELHSSNVNESGYELRDSNVNESGYELRGSNVNESGYELRSSNVNESGYELRSSNVNESGYELRSSNVNESGYELQSNSINEAGFKLLDNNIEHAAGTFEGNIINEAACELWHNNVNADAYQLWDNNVNADSYTLQCNDVKENAFQLHNNNDHKAVYEFRGNNANEAAFKFRGNDANEAAYEFRGNDFNEAAFEFLGHYANKTAYKSRENNVNESVFEFRGNNVNGAANQFQGHNVHGAAYEFRCNNDIKAAYEFRGNDINEASYNLLSNDISKVAYNLKSNKGGGKLNTSLASTSNFTSVPDRHFPNSRKNTNINDFKKINDGPCWKKRRQLVVKFHPHQPTIRKVLLK